jgi:hypothetical protein
MQHSCCDLHFAPARGSPLTGASKASGLQVHAIVEVG